MRWKGFAARVRLPEFALGVLYVGAWQAPARWMISLSSGGYHH